MLKEVFNRVRSAGRRASRTAAPTGFVPAAQARDLILSGRAPSGLFTDELVFSRQDGPVVLPPRLRVRTLVIEDCPGFTELPEDLFSLSVVIRGCENFSHIHSTAWMRSLTLESCGLASLRGGLELQEVAIRGFPELTAIPPGFRCDSLELRNTLITEIPPLFRARKLDLAGSRSLERLPDMRLEWLSLRGCTALRYLPDRLECELLDLSGCTGLRWQDFAAVGTQELILADCETIDRLPDWLLVWGSIDVANTALSSLPQSLQHCKLLWRGIPIDENVAFHPERITVSAVMDERNAELRRVMLERIGLEKFLSEANTSVVHSDTDAGGERKLLRYSIGHAGSILALMVSCPSTGRRYFIRVPPYMTSCHQAAAWIAGFENAHEYQCVVET